MKKIGVVLLLLFATGWVYAVDIIPKVSVCLPGTFRSDYEVEVGFNVGAEGRFYLSEYFAVAAGFDYLIDRKISKGKKTEGGEYRNQYYDNSKFNFLPVYVGIICFPFGNYANYKPYFRLDGGYNVLFSVTDGVNSKPGYYFGGGAGVELYERCIFEIYAARYEADDNDNKITYKNIFFRVGYKFEI